MSLRKLFWVMGVFLLVVTFSSFGLACDDEKRMEISVQAPIETVDCTNTPATIGVLGLTIDISNASFSPRRHGTGPTCTDLAVGQTVEVALTSDVTDTAGRFTAAEVEIRGNKNNGVKINAPFQAVDTSGTTVSILSLTVDIGSAILLNDNKRPITASQLKADQFARLTLASNAAPLTAKKVQVRVNQVSVQAPLDAFDCEATPATITLLGLKVDVSKAVFGPRWHKTGLTCNDLETGQVVEAYLTSDISDSATGLLTATQLDLQGGWWRRGAAARGCWDNKTVKIDAPLQTVDISASTVTVLGLLIDIGNTALFNEELELISSSQLKAGQFAKLTLKSDSLAATTLLVHVDEVKVKAPVTAFDCEASPQTVTMLGLTIDVTNASFGLKSKWHWGHGKHGWHHGEFTCDDLKVGQTVAVELTGDVTDTGTGLLTAREVEVRGGHDDDVMVSAPLQAIDPSAKTVTVLGLLIDMSAAKLKDDNEHTIALDQLIQGQFADIDLTSDQTPFLAVSLVARTGTNQLHIRVFDEKGKLVTGGKVKATVTVRNGKSVVVREATGTGSLILTSIPAGQAKIAITRVYDGKTSKAKASVAMKSNTNKLINARLKVVK
jgi:hypothetical protein